MKDSTSFGIAILAVCLAVAVPLVLQSDPGRDFGTGQAENPELEELRHLREAQEQTASSMERLALALEQSQAMSRRQQDNPGKPGAADVGSYAALIESLDALRASIEEDSLRTQEMLLRNPGGEGESLVTTRRRNTVTLWSELEALEQAWRVDEEAASRSQYFQTAKDLLQAFGPPTEIFRPKSGILFYYRNHPPGTPGPAWYFRLQDDMVVEFFLEDEMMKEESE